MQLRVSRAHDPFGGRALTAAFLRALVDWCLLTAIAVTSAALADSPLDRQIEAALDDERWALADSLARAWVGEVESADPVDSLTWAAAQDLLVQAWIGEGVFQQEAVEEQAVQVLAFRESRLGPDDPLVAESLIRLSDVLSSTGRHDEARPLIERALTINRAALGPDDAVVAANLHTLARTVILGGDCAEGERLARESLTLKEKIYGPESPKLITTLTILASCPQRAGRLDEARELRERALALAEVSYPPDHPRVIAAMSSLASFYYDAEDLASAVPLRERTLALQEARLGPDHPDVAMELNNLAVCYRFLGRKAEALVLMERALAIRETVYGEVHETLAVTHYNIGTVYLEDGNYPAARQHFEAALEIMEAALGPDHPNVGKILNGLGAFLYNTGDYPAALTCFERARAIYEPLYGPTHPVVGYAISGAANVRWRSGDPEGAKPLYEEALAIQEESLGSESIYVGYTLLSYGECLQDLNDIPGAIAVVERALTIQEKAHGSGHSGYAQTLARLGNLRLEQRDFEGARGALTVALDTHLASVGRIHPQTARGMANLALCEAMAGETERALELALEAEAIGREHFRETVQFYSEREALSLSGVRGSGLEVALTLTERDLDPLQLEAIWSSVLASRALVLDEMASRSRRSGERAEADSLRRALGEASRVLSQLQVKGEGKNPDAYASEVAEARKRRERLERDLAEVSATFAEDQLRAHLELADVVAAMPEGSALVAYAGYASRTHTAAGDPTYMAFVLSDPGGSPVAVSLGDADDIHARIDRWREEAGRGPLAAGRSREETESACRRAGITLREALWDPVADLVADADRVFVVPDHALHLVNPAAYPVAENAYLVEEGPTLHLISTERDLVSPPPTRPGTGGLLAMGGVMFDDPASPDPVARSTPTDLLAGTVPGQTGFRGDPLDCPEFLDVRFDPLPASAEEADRVSRVWRTVHGGGGVITLTGRNASEQALKRLGPDHEVLHLATHGFFLDTPCLTADPALRGIGGMAPTRPRGEDGSPLENADPLRLSGLALAGANLRASADPSGEDGILTAEELAALDLGGVRWAVLSACDTGVGPVAGGGEGVLGLRRALHVAGARTVILSLWSVRDDMALAWMESLYTAHLEDGQATAEAVRTASRRLLEARRAAGESTHPFYWAGFVAAGDWR